MLKKLRVQKGFGSVSYPTQNTNMVLLNLIGMTKIRNMWNHKQDSLIKWIKLLYNVIINLRKQFLE